MEHETGTGDAGPHRRVARGPWLALMAGAGVAALTGWSMAGLCALSTRQACTVGFTVGPLAPMPPAPAAPFWPSAPQPQTDAARPPPHANRTVAGEPGATPPSEPPAPQVTTPDIPFTTGNPETANPAYVALVIGNASYSAQTRLRNPHNDARAIARRLHELNYTLVGGGPQLDLDKRQFLEILETFYVQAKTAKVGIIYYAGHGIQIDATDPIYLIPVDAKLARERDLKTEAIKLADLQDRLPSASRGSNDERYGVIILDACRNSNFPLEDRDGVQRGSGLRGLKVAKASDRSFIAFSASAGEQASDGEGQNSPYVQALSRAMQPRDRELPKIKQVFDRVAEEFRNNGQKQEPAKFDEFDDRDITLAAPQKPRAVGWTGKDCPQCPQIKVLSPGSFMIGSPESEPGSYPDERPQKKIKFPRPFAIGVTEVTFQEFDACVAAGYCTTRPEDEKWGRGNLPVINVTWQDAKQYAQWLTVMTGNHYRLLSEAEWEYAARAGTTSAYPWGNKASRDHANYGGVWPEGSDRPEDGMNPKKEGADRWLYSAPVRSFGPNPWDLHEMHGNVAEWVEDCYPNLGGGLGGRSYTDMPPDGSAYRPTSCKENIHAYRGGSWDAVPALIRSAARDGTSTSTNFIGFRIARDN